MRLNRQRSQTSTKGDDYPFRKTLALILVYVGLSRAHFAESMKAYHFAWALPGLAGLSAPIWPLYNSVYPIPDFPRNLWADAVIVWGFWRMVADLSAR
jgi:hypothetical protein